MRSDREKLIALMEEAYFCGIEQLADHLISHGVVVRKKGEWKPRFIYTGKRFDSCTQGVEGWECSNCGYTTLEKFDFCTCGADMRKGENG